MENRDKNAIPVREDLLTRPLHPLEEVRLVGSRCRDCNEVMLGKTSSCSNCAGENMTEIPLSKTGKLWTYTIIRHRPPGQYRGPDPFVPFAEGLVELPDGIRVVAVLDGDIEKIKIGMDLELLVHELYTNGQGQTVVAFKFKAAE